PVPVTPAPFPAAAPFDPDAVPDVSAPVPPPPVAPLAAPPMTSLPVPVRPQVTALAVRLPPTSFELAFDRYRDQHRDPGGRIGTSFPEVDKLSGGLRGLVLIDGTSGEGRSTLGHQIVTQALLGDSIGSIAAVVISTGL